MALTGDCGPSATRYYGYARGGRTLNLARPASGSEFGSPFAYNPLVDTRQPSLWHTLEAYAGGTFRRHIYGRLVLASKRSLEEPAPGRIRSGLDRIRTVGCF